jgi:hypothetical protein|tara:strand:+ start:346 stop:2730 length:2385 start_codon:yes stop_codon:yes gene_type:complete
MINTSTNSAFPSQVVPEAEKRTWEYGLRVAQAIEYEWFRGGRLNASRWSSSYQNYHKLRLYARGEQSVEKYKNELSINGDLSYLNLDWKPVPVVPKFVDIVVNGISSKNYDIKAYAQDPFSQKLRTQYADSIMRDMMAKPLIDNIQKTLGVTLYNSIDPANLPQNKEELEVHMQLDYKQSVEIAEEEVINNVLEFNKYKLTNKRVTEDIVTIGIGAVKTTFNKSEGVVVDYVDPANLIYSYTDDPNFQDCYYVGEVKSITLPELKKEFPDLSDEELKKLAKFPGRQGYARGPNTDNDLVQVLYFEYKTYVDQVFKIKRTETGLEKILEKPDTFNPPASDNFERVSRSIEVLFTGAKVMGVEQMLKWEMSENMTRPKSDLTKVNLNYCITAPHIYQGRINSLVGRITSFADMIQLTSLKLQQVIQRMVPDGVFVDVDGLAEVDLGNGTNYNPQEALNMYFQTGSIVGRSLTQDGDPNRGKVPIQELQSSSGNAKIQSLIQTYQYYLQMIRDVTGLNEARDGSMPDRDSLVGLQKMAANASNTATKHILNASLYLTLRTCENISLRVADMLQFELTNEALIDSIGSFNVSTLREVEQLHLYDFGVFLELEPEDEDKAMLEQNIQMALQQQQIYLEDAIDIRQINNIKLANQVLKYRRVKKQEQDQKQQQQTIESQSQANQQATEAAAMQEVEKQQALSQTQIEIEQAKSQFEIQRMQSDASIKRELMAQEFEYDMKLKQMDIKVGQQKEQEIENRKDQRTKIQATQQSQMISQRQSGGIPTDFEAPSASDLTGFSI